MMSFKHINTQATTVACVLLILLPAVVRAQPDTLWHRSFIPGGSPMAVIETFDGGFAIGTADWQGDENRRDQDYMLIKTDSVGVLEWQEFYTLDPDTLHQNERCYGIQQLSDSGYVLVGTGPGGAGAMIVRIDAEGEMIFSRDYPNGQFGEMIDCVLSDEEDIVVVTRGACAKLDRDNGDIIWRNGYAFQGSGEVRQVTNTYDGGYLLTGKISSIGEGGWDIYAVKIDTDGEVEWRNAYGTDYNESTFDAVQTADGGYCIAGFSNRGGNYNAGVLVRIDADGEEIWRNIFVDEDDNPIFGSIKALTETPDGGFAFIRDGGNYSASMGRVSHDGELMWTSAYRIGGDSGNSAYSIIMLKDFGYVLGGFAGQIGDWLVRTEPDSLSVIAWNLQVSDSSHDFGSVPIDTTLAWELILTNEGQQPIEVLSITTDSAAFSVEFEDVLTLESDEEASIPVTFTPTDSLAYTGALTIHTYWRDVVVELSGAGVMLSVSEEPDILREFSLHNACPNPFNTETSIHYSIPSHSDVSLAIFDLYGRRIMTLVNEHQKAGYHTVIWNGKSENGIPVSSGLYFYRINAGNFTKVRKMTMVK